MPYKGQSANIAANRVTLKVHDCVLVQQGTNPQQEICRVTAILNSASGSGEQQLRLARFLRPEDVLGGRQPFHGDKELIESDGVLVVPLSAVKGRCRVFSLDKYQHLTRVGPLDFFARLAYKVSQEEFVPARMPVHCVCEVPYNPDRFMVQCTACLDWFHPECCQCSVRALGAASNWKCPDCAGPAAAAGGDGEQDDDPFDQGLL